MTDRVALNAHLRSDPLLPAEAAEVVLALAGVARSLAGRISLGALGGALSARVGENADGDDQKALDVLADEAVAFALKAAPVRWYASEERGEVEMLNPDGTLAVAVDPLDGSSNIDVNVSIGTIFSIFEAAEGADASFLRPGREQVASGYFIYGPQTALALATRSGVTLFVLDRGAGEFGRARKDVSIPRSATEFAINASNYRHWSKPIRAYIDDCLSGEEGPSGRNFNMRWIASLVAETHRILMRGGIFLYPGDARKGYGRGRLRHVYECAPIAFLIHQAGGLATDPADPVLDRVPAALHERTPFVFGSADKVARVVAYHDLPDSEVAPLFRKRGLFSA